MSDDMRARVNAGFAGVLAADRSALRDEVGRLRAELAERTRERDEANGACAVLGRGCEEMAAQVRQLERERDEARRMSALSELAWQEYEEWRAQVRMLKEAATRATEAEFTSERLEAMQALREVLAAVEGGKDDQARSSHSRECIEARTDLRDALEDAIRRAYTSASDGRVPPTTDIVLSPGRMRHMTRIQRAAWDVVSKRVE